MTPEQEIKLLKELLYCTKRSCNNCGKVNCGNFQRQRIDCCGLWVSYKDYIKQQEEQIADIKANCDLAIEGRDLEIKQLKMSDEYIIKTLESKVEKLQEDLRHKRISIKNKKAEINELKLELTVEKDQHQEEINLHLHAEDYIKSLEQQIEKMKCCENCNHKKSEVDRCELLMYSLNACLCKNKDKWEIKEND